MSSWSPPYSRDFLRAANAMSHYRTFQFCPRAGDIPDGARGSFKLIEQEVEAVGRSDAKLSGAAGAHHQRVLAPDRPGGYRMNTISRLSACLAISLLAISGHAAWPQTITTVKVVVPVPPGGANDFLARVLAEQIGAAQGIAFTIENRTGAGGIIGAEAVSRAAPDGSTLLMDSNSLLIDALAQKTSYHPLTSFEPICNLVDAPTVLTVNGASPYRRLADLIDAARAKPREITLATIGPGGTFRIGFEKLRRAANVDMTFVPYPGLAPAVNALLGAHVSSVFSTYSTVSEQVNAGR